MRRFRRIWPARRPLIGVVHLLPLPGAPGWGDSMAQVLERAERDALALIEGGFDGLIVENYGDVPFVAGEVAPETVAAMALAVGRVVGATDVPVGVNVLRNDARAALGLAAATGARFVRVNVHTGAMWTDQGLIQGRADATVRARETLALDVAILADVHVKHAIPPAGSRLADAARDAWHRGLADALVVTGTGTGRATALDDVAEVTDAIPEAQVLVGSGVTVASVAETLTAAGGAIVGSDVMEDGVAGRPVDRARARALVDAARSVG